VGFNVSPRPALVSYIGQLIFTTSGTSSTTAQVTLSASVQDPTGLVLNGATMTFKDATSGAILASNVPVSPVAGAPGTGTANKIVTLSTGNYGASAYEILVVMTGGYDNSGQALPDKSATVVVTKPAAANEITGGGSLLANANKAGTYGLTQNGAATLEAGINYNKQLTNLQGQIYITIPQANGTKIIIKSNSLTSMTVANLPGTPVGKQATIYTKASISRQNSDGTVTAIQGNVTLRMDLTDYLVNNASTPDKVGITALSSQDSTLFFSNDWQLEAGSWKTIMDNLATGSGNWIGQ
jgi:hypothetical protein